MWSYNNVCQTGKEYEAQNIDWDRHERRMMSRLQMLCKLTFHICWKGLQGPWIEYETRVGQHTIVCHIGRHGGAFCTGIQKTKVSGGNRKQWMTNRTDIQQTTQVRKRKSCLCYTRVHPMSTYRKMTTPKDTIFVLDNLI